MENASYIALSRQLSVQRNLELIANNVANASTTGYKGQHLMFEEYLQEGGQSSYEMVSDYGQFMDTSQGALMETGNPLDLGLDGKGFLRVDAPGAARRYTRDGEFTLNAAREIVTTQGYPLLDIKDAPIEIAPNTTEIRITKDGTVMADGIEVTKIGIWEFENIQELAQVGNNLYASKNAPFEAEETTIVQGTLEKSNVQPVIELTRMMKISREYGSNKKVIDNEHERQMNAIRKLGEQK